MKLSELLDQLSGYHPDSKVTFLTDAGCEEEVLTIYSEHESPDDREVCIDLGVRPKDEDGA